MWRSCLIAGFVLVWASVLAIPLGERLQTLSPRYEEYRRRTIQEMAGTGPEERLNPAGRMGLLLSVEWPFATSCCFCGFIGMLFTAGVFIIQGMAHSSRQLALLGAGAFGLGCLIGALLGVRSAVDSFGWGFIALGFGYLLSAAGLVVGALGIAGSCLNGGPDRASVP